jgi:ankyrin repeat protein
MELIRSVKVVLVTFVFCCPLHAIWGASGDSFFLSGGNAMIYGIRNGDRAMISSLLKKGLDVNSSVCRGSSPLNLSLRLQAFDVARFLVGRGANVDFVDESGETAITISIKYKYFKFAKFLIAKSRNVDVPDKSGDTPLILAVKYQNLELFKMLLGRDANIFWKNQDSSDIFYFLEKYTDIVLMYEFLRLLPIH